MTPVEDAMTHDTFQAGDLTAVIGDNAASGAHRAGYNGVWSLTHRTAQANLFVPAVASLNLEHIFDGDHRDQGNAHHLLRAAPRPHDLPPPVRDRGRIAPAADAHVPP